MKRGERKLGLHDGPANVVRMKRHPKHATLEILAYIACAAIAAIMTSVAFRAGHPPWFYWLLVLASAAGIVRIFTLAWHEDRPASR